MLESAISGKADIAKILEHFRLSGVRILMDDFGTGYSSLATLNMHCFDTLKLDKSLIDCIGEKDGETLLHYVIKMGRHLGLHITAEGVEYESQLSYLRNRNVMTFKATSSLSRCTSWTTKGLLPDRAEQYAEACYLFFRKCTRFGYSSQNTSTAAL